MSVYEDGKVKIDGNSIHFVGLIIPKFSILHLKAADIETIDVVKLGLLDRFRIQGTWNLKTWWCFDLSRPLKKEGIKVTLKRPIGPIDSLGFTVDDIKGTKRVLRENFEEIFTG